MKSNNFGLATVHSLIYEQSLVIFIKDEYEFRLVECKVFFHQPKENIKTIIRTDNSRVVREEPMTQRERQENLFE